MRYSVFIASVILFISVFGRTNALSCSHQYECTSVSNDYNFVACSEGSCQCRAEFGFVGSATAEDKCRCDDGNVFWGLGNPYCKPCTASSVIYDQGIPYCVDPAACEAGVALHSRQEAQKEVVRTLYNNLIYPAPLPIVQSMNVEGIFTQDVRGRVTPAGDFDDIEGSIEYFFGLAASPGGYITEVNFIELYSEGNHVSVRVDVLFNFSSQGMRNLTQTGFYTFNDDILITSYDLDILRLGKAIDLPAFTHAPSIQQICQAIQFFCPVGSPNNQYADFDACVSFMNSIDYGTWAIAESNSVVCRQLHSILIPYRPQIHCPHVGPTGGGKCIDRTYEEWYTESF